MIKNIIWLTIIIGLIMVVFYYSNKRDQVLNEKFDSCMTEYRSEGIPLSAYEAFMKPCMDNK